MRSTRFRTSAGFWMIGALLLALLVPLNPAGAASASAASPLFRISGTALFFGNVPVGTTSPAQAITITNVSTENVLMSGAGGAAGSFGGSQNCQGRTLAPGASCQMFYAFTPDALGAATGSTSGSWNGQGFSFSFQGSGINRFRISPTSLDFGSVPVGTTSDPQSVNVTNASSSPALISMSGGGAGLFGGLQNCQGRTLGAYESCQVTYRFSPTANGPATGTTGGTINNQAFSLSFAGTGVDRFIISPTSLDFGEVPIGTTGEAQTVNVTNASDEPAVIQMSGGGAGEYGGSQNCQGNTIAAGASCQISYRLTPAAAGVRPGGTNGTINGQPFEFTMTGVGVNGVLTTAAPVISGDAAVSRTLRARTDGWTAGTTFTYQWYRGGAALPGATGETYIPVAADLGSTLTVTVTGSKLGYTSVSRTSAPSAAVLNVFTTLPTPTISGTAKVGQKLTVVPGSWSPSATLSYQWRRADAPISGATGATYTLTNADVGSRITVTVTARRSGYITSSRTSAATASVTGGILTAPTPTVTGNAVVGQKVTAVPGSWTAGTTLTYQWKRGGTAIAGATSNFHTVNAADAGQKLTVTVTGTKAGYTTVSKTSAATATVLDVFTTTPTPTITGTAAAGSKLTATTGVWAPAPSAFTYQWKRSGTAISGATASTYTAKAADAGKKITVTVTATRSGFQSVSKTSASVTVAGSAQ